jgi:hypothetical protein
MSRWGTVGRLSVSHTGGRLGEFQLRDGCSGFPPEPGEPAQPCASRRIVTAGVGFEPTNDLDGHCRFSRSDLSPEITVGRRTQGYPAQWLVWGVLLW